MKLSCSLALLLAGGSNSALALVTDTDDLVYAISRASYNPASPSLIEVDVTATIDFDAGGVDADGLDLDGKYFRAECVGSDDTNKCTLERSASGGRFFKGVGPLPLDVSFEGFEFVGGSAPLREEGGGGAFSLRTWSDYAAHVTFVDCDFIDNDSPKHGGAVYISQDVDAESASSLSFTRCTFESNTASTSGGAIYAGFHGPSRRSKEPSGSGLINLLITQSAFSNNQANSYPESDIVGEEHQYELNDVPSSFSFGKVALTCTEMTEPFPQMEFGPFYETCSTTAAPTSAPSVSAAPSSAPTSSAPSSAPTSSAPSSAPTRGWSVITYDDFENNWGSFENRLGYDSIRINTENARDEDKGAYVPDGKCAIRLRDKASLCHKEDHDVSDFTKLRVSFSMYARNTESSDDLWLEYSSDGGDTWEQVKRFVFYDEEVTDFTKTFIDDNYSFTTTARIRFKWYAAKDDKMYIDNVKFEGYYGN